MDDLSWDSLHQIASALNQLFLYMGYETKQTAILDGIQRASCKAGLQLAVFTNEAERENIRAAVVMLMSLLVDVNSNEKQVLINEHNNQGEIVNYIGIVSNLFLETLGGRKIKTTFDVYMMDEKIAILKGKFSKKPEKEVKNTSRSLVGWIGGISRFDCKIQVMERDTDRIYEFIFNLETDYCKLKKLLSSGNYIEFYYIHVDGKYHNRTFQLIEYRQVGHSSDILFCLD